MTKAALLRELFRNPGVVRIVGAHDGLSAKLVERNGFEGIWASSLEVSCSYAVPDADILSMSQYLERARSKNDVVSIPLVADCDTGYGNSLNVIHMVRQYEAAGIAAVCIEDKAFPKVNSLLAGGRQELAPLAEFVGKILAAKNAQESEDFMVIARVEALIAGWGLEEALRRAEAYATAGADAVLIHSRASTPDEVKAFCDQWNHRAPVVIVPTKYPMITETEMEPMGVKMVIYANHGLRAALKAMDDTFRKIHDDGGTNQLKDSIAPLDLVFEIQGMADMMEAERAYLPTPDEKTRVVILAAGEPSSQDGLHELLADRPLVMLDIGGKSLLQRNAETLRRKGLDQISVVVGYEKEQIDVDAVTCIDNPEYRTTHILQSIMKAESLLHGRVLLIYGDMLFDKSILDVLLTREEDIVLVADPTFLRSRQRNKKLDLLKTEFKPAPGRRSLAREINPVREIALQAADAEADYEFIGMVLFSAEGIEAFRSAYAEAQETYAGIPFQQARTFDQADLTDMLNHMIQKGYPVHALEVTSGWTEVHTFEDYRLACRAVY